MLDPGSFALGELCQSWRREQETFYALTEQRALWRQFRYEKVGALVNVSRAYREQ